MGFSTEQGRTVLPASTTNFLQQPIEPIDNWQLTIGKAVIMRESRLSAGLAICLLPHPGFYLGGDMSAPPVPNIYFPGSSSSGSTVTIQESTTGFCSVDGTIDNNNAGFTGAGFCNTTNATGSGINWSISVPTAGTYTISWR